jgi:hypothetical protein
MFSAVTLLHPKPLPVAVLDAGRNSMSFFMLLVVSLGLSVVSESLGRTMFRCQLLAGAHFVFGSKFCQYGVGGNLTVTSTVCHWHCRIGNTVDLRLSPLIVHRPSGLYPEWILAMDYVCIKWLVPMYSLLMGPSNTNYSHYRTATIPQTTLQA